MRRVEGGGRNTAGDGAPQIEEAQNAESDAERDMIEENNSQGEDQHPGAGSLSLSATKPPSSAAAAAGIAQQLVGATVPTPSDAKQCLVFMDLAIRFQMIIFDLSSGIWWASVAEVLVFMPFGFFVFCLDPDRVGPIWMFIPHLVRALLGLLIIKKMPTTQELVQ